MYLWARLFYLCSAPLATPACRQGRLASTFGLFGNLSKAWQLTPTRLTKEAGSRGRTLVHLYRASAIGNACVMLNARLMMDGLNDEVSDTCLTAGRQQAMPQRTKVCNKK